MFVCVQFARSPEEDEDKETATHIGNPLKAVQVHRAARALQEALVPRRVSSRAEAEQHSRRRRLGVFPVCRGRARRKRPEPWTLREPREEPQSLAVFRRRERRDD